MTETDLVHIVRAASQAPLPAGMATRVVAVDGPSGAGKSTLAARLAHLLGGCPVVPSDDFASWEDPLGWADRFTTQVLEPLRRGEQARYKRRDWDLDRLAEWRDVLASPVVVIEGVATSRNRLRPYLTYVVWVTAPRELRLRRGLERDGEEARPLWERWMAMEDAWMVDEQPNHHADATVLGA